MSTETIAGHFCGQTQSHSAHVWHAPVPFGSTMVSMPRQCAGLIAPLGQAD